MFSLGHDDLTQDTLSSKIDMCAKLKNNRLIEGARTLPDKGTKLKNKTCKKF